MHKLVVISFLVLSLISMSWIINPVPNNQISDESSVASILVSLGDKPVPHQPNLNMKGVSAKKGEQLVKYGMTRKPNGAKTRKQSRHFVCTSCHNIEREDPDLANPNPEDRLVFVKEKGLPFLQASPLYGIANRLKFYNDDYFKKYGDLVDKARNDIRASIQLCATECAQGRKLKGWEIESILAYFWDLELKVKDLHLSEAEKSQINHALENNTNQEKAITNIKSKYLDHSPAHQSLPPEDRMKGYDVKPGNVEIGKSIYELSCKHCHYKERYSFFLLDDTKDTFKHLTHHISKYSRYSIYQVARWGTTPLNGKRAYMPFYTQEKMSNQQMEDLRAYLESMSD